MRDILQEVTDGDYTGFGQPKSTKKELLLKCECSCSVLSVSKYSDEDDYSLVFYQYSLPYISFWRKIKLAIDVLKGKNIRTADIILSNSDFKKLKKF